MLPVQRATGDGRHPTKGANCSMPSCLPPAHSSTPQYCINSETPEPRSRCRHQTLGALSRQLWRRCSPRAAFRSGAGRLRRARGRDPASAFCGPAILRLHHGAASAA
eukprot:364189-Chlamydomonas_euryale.AAC.36